MQKRQQSGSMSLSLFKSINQHPDELSESRRSRTDEEAEKAKANDELFFIHTWRKDAALER
jgi:hypothetical protein